MTKKQKWIIVAGIALLACYLGCYAYARVTHQVVRLQNRSGGGQQIVAQPDPWNDIMISLSEAKPMLKAYAHGQKRTPGFLNVFFWPLRLIEAAWWNWTQE